MDSEFPLTGPKPHRLPGNPREQSADLSSEGHDPVYGSIYGSNKRAYIMRFSTPGKHRAANTDALKRLLAKYHNTRLNTAEYPCILNQPPNISIIRTTTKCVTNPLSSTLEIHRGAECELSGRICFRRLRPNITSKSEKRPPD